MSFENSLDIVRKLSEGKLRRNPGAKVVKYVPPPPPAKPAKPAKPVVSSPPVQSEVQPEPGPPGADVVYVSDEDGGDDSNAGQ